MLGSLCQLCRKRPATTHLTEVPLHGEAHTLHACSSCLKAMGLELDREPIPVAEILDAAASGVAPVAQKSEPATETVEVGKTCDECGLRWEEFLESNRFGCANDYTVFRDKVSEVLKEIHDTDSHVGKRPGDGPSDTATLEKRSLERQLEAAVREEHYEDAARLRDRLSSLEPEG